MRLTGHLLLPADPTGCRLSQGTVVVAGSGIESVLEHPLRDSAAPLILPGLVDAHLHLPQFDSIGRDGLPLLEWLERVIYPAEVRWADPVHAAAMTDRVLRQLASFGTTSFAAYATVHHEAARSAMERIAAFGCRALVGQVLMDRGAPTELLRSATRLIDEAQSFEPMGRVDPAVTPRFAVSCSEELLRLAGDLASRSRWAVQTHLAETQDECARVAELFGGARYAEVYARAGLLGSRTILAHGIHLEDPDLAVLRGRACVVAHCPTANAFLNAGAMDLARMRRAGVRVALGSDIAGGPDRSMVRVARAMIETAKRLGRRPPPATEAWSLVTGGNAEALGFADTGRIVPGLSADLVVVRPDVPWLAAPDPLSALMYAWDDRWIERTLVAGRPVYGAV